MKIKKISLVIAEGILIAVLEYFQALHYINPGFNLATNVTIYMMMGMKLFFISSKYNYSDSFSIWSDLLVDDYALQIGDWGEKLEPNTYGMALGLKKSGWPF